MKLDRTKPELIEDLIYYRGLGYGQEEISQKIDVPQSTVSRWLKKIKELEEEGRMSVSIGVNL